jgi:hypothetical protein
MINEHQELAVIVKNVAKAGSERWRGCQGARATADETVVCNRSSAVQAFSQDGRYCCVIERNSSRHGWKAVEQEAATQRNKDWRIGPFQVHYARFLQPIINSRDFASRSWVCNMYSECQGKFCEICIYRRCFGGGCLSK